MSEQNSIEIISVPLGAGESRLFALSGNYFELIDAANPVDVILSDVNGAQRSRMVQGTASFYSRAVNFSVVQITSASAQTIRFAYGSGETGTRRSTGSVTISGAVALDAATLAALESVDLNLATVNSIRRPEAHTASSNVLAALAANTAEQVFAAATNVNGVTLLAAQVSDFAGASVSSPTLLAKATAPTSVTDGVPFLMANIVDTTSGGNIVVEGSAFEKQFIPAGLGLYWISNVAISANGRRWTRYIVH